MLLSDTAQVRPKAFSNIRIQDPNTFLSAENAMNVQARQSVCHGKNCIVGQKSYNINVFSFRTRNFVTPIIESVRTPARITPYPTGRLFGVAIGVGTKVGFAPPSEPDCQISWIRLSSWWLAFERLAGASPELSGSFSRCLPLPGRPNRLWTRVEGSRTCFLLFTELSPLDIYGAVFLRTFVQRLHLPASLDSTGITPLLRYYGGSVTSRAEFFGPSTGHGTLFLSRFVIPDSYRSNFRPFYLQPPYAFLSFCSLCSPGIGRGIVAPPLRDGFRSWLRRRTGGLANASGRIKFNVVFVYGLVFRFRLLSTPHLNDAVTFRYGQASVPVRKGLSPFCWCVLSGAPVPGTSCQATIAPSLRDISQQALASVSPRRTFMLPRISLSKSGPCENKPRIYRAGDRVCFPAAGRAIASIQCGCPTGTHDPYCCYVV